MNSYRKKSRDISINKIAVIMAEDDNVAIAKKDIKKDTVTIYKDNIVTILDMIPKGHRFSLTDIHKDAQVVQYGYPFGLSLGIKKGRLINRHNIDDYKNDNYKTMVNRIFENNKNGYKNRIDKRVNINKTFMGYRRNNGQVGTRNYYLIVPTSLCASDVAVKIANSIDTDNVIKKKYKNINGVVASAHTEGCGCNDGEIIDRLISTLKNIIIHPNVGGALIIDLGCEKTNLKNISKYFRELAHYKKPIDFMSIQTIGGTGKAFVKGKSIILKRLKVINSVKREKVSIRHLVIGTECGASDSFSGITANPIIGRTVDKIILAGGSAILSETPEMIGAELCLIKRMASRKIAEKFVKGMNYYKSLANRLNVSMNGNFVAGNIEGGLINLTLKSLGAILKGGNTRIVDSVDYSERIKRQGLSIMNGPGNDLESMTGIVASGANIILFSTGMGATEGNLITPVIKISTRTETYNKMREDIDFDAGRLLCEDISLDELSDSLLDLVIKVASGNKTWAEIWEKRSFQIWTAGKLSL